MTEESAVNKKKLNIAGVIKLKYIRRVLFAVNAVFLIPVFVLALFNTPSADDFSMAFEVHEAYIQTGNVLFALLKGVYMGIWYYMNWTGYFFSDMLTALCPAVFSEKFYFLGTWAVLCVSILGIWYFFRQLFANVLRLTNDLAGCITGVTLFALIQCMPEGGARNESFFWYSGAINYMFMFGLGLMWLGLLLREACIQQNKPYRIQILALLGFLLGGANYMTALSLGILSFIVLLITCIHVYMERQTLEKQIELRKNGFIEICDRLSAVSKIWLPALLQLIGLFLAIIAPGNRNRETGGEFSPIKSVFMALYFTMDNMLGKWLSWQVICCLVLLVPFLWKAAGRIKRFYGFGHPALFVTFCFLLSAANITPPVYATGNIEAGRIMGIFYMQSMVLLVLSIGYICGWIRVVIKPGKLMSYEDIGIRKPADLLFDGYLGKDASKVFVTVAIVTAIASAMAIRVNTGIYMGTSAAYSIYKGYASTYHREATERTSILKDKNIHAAELKEFSVKPSLLYFSDITEDKDDWLNKAVADYYHKRSVVLIKNKK